MENRIKECQLDLYADALPTATMRANQLSLWLSSFAYVLMCALRRIGLAGTELARATCGSIRLKLLKIGAQVTVSARRVRIAMATACPARDIFAIVHARLRRPFARDAPPDPIDNHRGTAPSLPMPSPSARHDSGCPLETPSRAPPTKLQSLPLVRKAG